MKRKSRVGAGDPEFNSELDEQVTRLREMLVLMAPETGSSALGAMRKAFPDSPLRARVRALEDYRRSS